MCIRDRCTREAPRPGAFDAARASELGITAGPDFGRLQRGETLTAPDGSTVTPDDVLGPTRPGRSLIVSGDNRDPMRLLDRAGPVQLLVHEATYTEDVLAGMGGDDRGHSTAARVAKAAELQGIDHLLLCLLYTSPSPRDATLSRMPSSA